ncbi:MAG: ATP synthase F1 subunit gamma [Blastochloris sp.]|nr:ATP synthase F1 subunit gamma [Blastochloris sp.]
MANTREIRRRIKSIKNTAQITKAMQMVASSKMRKAQMRAVAGRPYARMLDEVTAHLSENSGEITHPLLDRREIKKRGILIITSDKGLCGALNTNLLRDVMKADTGNSVYVTIGRKGRGALARLGKDILADFEMKENFRFADSKRVSKLMLDKYLAGEIDTIEVYYNKFVNTLVQEPTQTQLVPIQPEMLGHTEDGTRKATEYIFEPKAQELLAQLLPYFVHYELYQRILDAHASEHSARMVAMKNATDNAKQLVKELTLEYNKVRQASITTELLEISTAAAVLA